MAHVELRVYDLSRGLAQQLSDSILGKHIDGIWHTGVVVFGKEHYYGGGIQIDPPECVTGMLGPPARIVRLGTTDLTPDVFEDFLRDLSARFTPANYHLLRQNCNHFSNEVAQFLTGQSIPSDIIELPNEIFNSPGGRMLQPYLDQMDNLLRGQHPSAISQGDLSSLSREFQNLNRADGLHPGITGPELVAALCHEEEATRASGHRHLLLHLPTIRDHRFPLLATAGSAEQVIPKLRAMSAELGPVLGLTPKEDGLLNELEAYMIRTQNVDSAGTSSGTLGEAPNPKIYKLLGRLISSWPPSGLFSPLFLLRLLVLNPITHRQAYAVSLDPGDDHPIIDILERFCSHGPDAVPAPKSAQLMAICVATNMFSSPNGALYMVSSVALDVVVAAIVWALQHEAQTIRVTGAALAYNCSLHIPKGPLTDQSVLMCLRSLVNAIETERDEETARRLLLAIGQFLYCNDAVNEFVQSLGFNPLTIHEHSATIQTLAREVASLL
eukprot:gnl/Spiro4/23414_TR11584_c0_g1_i1.p1 gnl/Spiro4/23414_TR11584_c0_g1~~gnl/Spiro4/23414_TR11584_c0_g1_i1.p1  ORF type:complete len:497 (+),score=69.76 gnl/Spiro4/23414_TR11584_c0_g1_i1:45-1535(+)